MCLPKLCGRKNGLSEREQIRGLQIKQGEIVMHAITVRPYRRLADFMKVYDFLLKNYTRDWSKGVPAPFFEYAQMLYWTDVTQTHRNGIWECDGAIVGFRFYESQIGSAYFCANDQHEDIISDMILYAQQRLSKDDGSLKLILFASQTHAIRMAQHMGYKKESEYDMGVYDFSKGALDYKLPEGFSFEEPGKFDMKKMIEASWRGFDHDTEPEGGVERGYNLISAPHATPQLDVVIKNVDNAYVCYAGMWMARENSLAYLEPLCTVPEYRGIGLASAALSELYRRTIPLGATHMTGGADQFYFKIGYDPFVTWTVWIK